MLQGRKLHALVLLATLASGIWLAFNLTRYEEPGLTPCLVKNLSGYPCPACGSSRSFMAIFHGHFEEAFFINPFGFLSLALLLILPVLTLSDLFTGKQRLNDLVNRVNTLFTKAHWYLPAILLVVGNWIWNIFKGL